MVFFKVAIKDLLGGNIEKKKSTRDKTDWGLRHKRCSKITILKDKVSRKTPKKKGDIDSWMDFDYQITVSIRKLKEKYL